METKAATDATATPADESDAARTARLQGEAMEAMKAKYPGKELRLATHPFGEWMIHRVPTRPEWRIYLQKRSEPATELDAADMLVDTCVVYPDKPELMKQLDNRPALTQKWAGEIVGGAGLLAEVTSKKF